MKYIRVFRVTVSKHALPEIKRNCHSPASKEIQPNSLSYAIASREDPLMSDLLWERVDTDDECIPRMKQDNYLSEGELSDFEDGEYDSYSCSSYQSLKNDDAYDIRKERYSNKSNKIGIVTSKKTSQAPKLLGPINTRDPNHPDFFTDHKMSRRNVIKHADNFGSTCSTSSKKRSRRKKIDASKRVNELLAQQLSIMWCLKEFESKPSSIQAEANQETNVIGQVIQQGQELYFQPSIPTSSEISETESSASRATSTNYHKSQTERNTHTRKSRDNPHNTTEPEEGEIDSDTTSNSHHLHPITSAPKTNKMRSKKQNHTKLSEKRQGSNQRRSLRKRNHKYVNKPRWGLRSKSNRPQRSKCSDSKDYSRGKNMRQTRQQIANTCDSRSRAGTRDSHSTIANRYIYRHYDFRKQIIQIYIVILFPSSFSIYNFQAHQATFKIRT